MSGLRRWTVTLFFAAFVCGLPPRTASASVITDASLTISGITITPSAGSVLVDPWTAEASASANNSLGQNSGQFDSSDTVALANAIITFANASATSNAAGLSITATSAVNLPGILNQAASTGLADLFTFFTITGGSGDVDVTFGMNVLPSQHAFVDSRGIVRSELVASLELDGDSVLFRDDLLQHASSPGGIVDPIRLTATRTLAFDTFYFVFVQADSESSGINLPEPTAVILVLTAFGLLGCYTFRKGAAKKA